MLNGASRSGGFDRQRQQPGSPRPKPPSASGARDLAERLASWHRRGRAHLNEDDLRHLGPLGVWETIRGFAQNQHRLADFAPGLDARSPEFIEWVLDAARLIGRYWFRFEVQGLEGVPPTGPVLLVGNHNGGIMPFDTVLTVMALWDRFGPDRAVNLLGHDLITHDPIGRKLAAKFGILRATPESASKALRAGRIVLVYPGSDLDSWRPWRDRNRVQLAGRTGFLRVALREGVPIVPVVSAGTHEQFVVLSTGRAIARSLQLKRRLRSEAFPIVFALPWGLTSGFFPYLPLPAQTTLRFGAPMVWEPVAPCQADDPELLTARYLEVASAMQALLDSLAAQRVAVLGNVNRSFPRWVRDALRIRLASSDGSSATS